jgi:hypothetical protein
MTLIETVARLKVLAGRRLAIIERAKDNGTPNHALLERIKIEREMLDTAPALLDALGAFQEGDAEKLADIEKWYWLESSHTEVILRYAAMARKMEAMQE